MRIRLDSSLRCITYARRIALVSHYDEIDYALLTDGPHNLSHQRPLQPVYRKDNSLQMAKMEVVQVGSAVRFPCVRRRIAHR
jgi:hypothetical protein